MTQEELQNAVPDPGVTSSASSPGPVHLSLRASVEALLFASGDGLTIEELVDYLETDQEAVERALEDLAKHYAGDPRSALKLTRQRTRYVLTTKETMLPVLERFFHKSPQISLSRAAYETLAVVAYNQPCTRAQIEVVRGVNSDSSITRLQDYGLIEIVDRLDAPGRPGLYACTQQFYRLFGLMDEKDLPARSFLQYATLEELHEEHEVGREEQERAARLFPHPEADEGNPEE